MPTFASDKNKTSYIASKCPLCPISQQRPNLQVDVHKNISHYHSDKYRSYCLCATCGLVFVPEQFHLNFSAQKKIYDKHNNDPQDLGYQNFLNRLMKVLIPKLRPTAEGLDFGCGPGPVLADMLRTAGYSMDVYDPIYAPNTGIFTKQYDFITATEVIEHFCNPAESIQKMWQCLKPNGWLGIMTKRVTSQNAFKNWHYIRDITHVSFFSEPCFEWLADQLGASLELHGADVALLQKPSDCTT